MFRKANGRFYAMVFCNWVLGSHYQRKGKTVKSLMGDISSQKFRCRVPTSKAQSAVATWLSVSHFRWKRGNTMKSVALLKQTKKQTNKIAMNPRLGKWISSVWNMTFQPQNLSTSLSLSLFLFLSLNTHSYTEASIEQPAPPQLQWSLTLGQKAVKSFIYLRFYP